MKKEFDVAIIGGGIAGLSATIYAKRFELNAVLFDEMIGGMVIKAGNIENYPGFIKIPGVELIEKIKEQAMYYKPEIINENVKKIEKNKKSFIVSTEKEKFSVKSVILATGTEWKKLNVPGEQKFKNKGVHYCAICDSYFYKGKIVAVVGSGNTAAREALLVAQTAKKVYLISKKEEIHPEPIILKQIKSAKNIEIIPKSHVIEILGDTKVNTIRLDKEFNNSKELKIDGVFIDVGHVVLSEIAKKIGVKTTEKGEIITNKSMSTNIQGFFAAGDVTNNPLKKAITASSEGCIAAHSAYEYLKK
ncbi:MAG: FAD-dependent oxidoreductase [Candidatus Pacearchaeota archaeon]